MGIMRGNRRNASGKSLEQFIQQHVCGGGGVLPVLSHSCCWPHGAGEPYSVTSATEELNSNLHLNIYMTTILDSVGLKLSYCKK